MDKINLTDSIISEQIPLVIPEEMIVRNQIRNRIDAYFQRHEIFPPVSYEQLSLFAGKLIEKYGWKKTHHAFVMLCCGNAIWRRIVGTVPFNRRILLLPQCLKHSADCQAEMDQMGLLCNDCGRCSIPAIIHEAENLGYLAIVTEGTTITTRLIESGKIDAVIGVGCMEVLQKMFASVNKYAVPGIGIPLLSCGCTDTKADIFWIKQELYHLRPDPGIRLLNLNHIKSRASSVFGEEQLHRVLLSGRNVTEQIVIDSLLSGGQRIRPFVALLAYEAFCANSDPEVVNRLVLSVECFHKASLIHDDIEDNDAMRYGKQTIHARYGVAVAINAGDLLIGEGYRLIAESELPSGMILDCMKIISTGHRAMTLGQGAELLAMESRQILSLEEILEVFENKTASALRVSFLLGATIGGADSDSLLQLSRFSHFLGIAYQIRDDLDDYSGCEGDIQLRKTSVLLSVLSDQMNADDRAEMEQAFKDGNTELIFNFMKERNTKEKTIDLLHQYLEEAKSCADHFQNQGLKLALHEILGKIFNEYL